MDNGPNLPVFWGVGHLDPEIPYHYARNSIEFVDQQVGLRPGALLVKEYTDMGHETCDDEMDDFLDWLRDAMSTEYDTDSGSSGSFHVSGYMCCIFLDFTHSASTG